MRTLHILSHTSGNRAYEDYYDNLKAMLCKAFSVDIIVYTDETTILPLVNVLDIFVFLNHVPPHFLNLVLDGIYKQVYLINTEQSTSMDVSHEVLPEG